MPPQPSEAQRFSYPFPLTLSDIEAMFARLTGATRPASSETGKLDSNSSKKPASEQQH
jgi:hypothetical protein